ncbi:CBS domain-containing protein [candidate division KSB1 bacterium]
MAFIKDIVGDRDVEFLQQEDTVKTAVGIMADKNIGALMVFNGDVLAGIFTERDLVKRVIAPGLDPAKTKIADVMTRKIVAIGPDETHIDALCKMRQINARHLPVVDGEMLVGVVSIRDLLAAEIDSKEEEIKWLNAYIHYTPPGKE